jgi:site-specific DNA recombinase
MIATYNQLTKEKQQNSERLNKQMDECEKKILRLEERYINEEIDRDLFLRYKEKFVAERRELEQNLQKLDNKLSNLETLIEKALHFGSKLKPLWDSGGYAQKQKLQNLVFPEGLLYNRKNDECRTPRINSVFSGCVNWQGF